jgi:hypothetical protein
MAINRTGNIVVNQEEKANELENRGGNPDSMNPSGGPVNSAGFVEVNQAQKANDIRNRALSEPSRHGN